MRCSVFDIRTDTWPDQYPTEARDAAVDRIVETIEASTFPWSRCVATMDLRRGRFPFPIEFWEPPSGGLGYVSTRRMWLMPASQGRPTFQTIAHELAHVADIYSMSSRGRWVEVTEERRPLYDMAAHHDRQDHPHGWQAGHSWNQHMVEAVTVPFTRAFWTDRKFHYPDDRFRWQGHTWGDVDFVRDTFLTGDRPMFTDVGSDSTHAAGIVWAAERGIVTGHPDGTFRPDEPVTRGQLASILHQMVEGDDV